MLQCAVACCSVISSHCNAIPPHHDTMCCSLLKSVAVCCAVRCSVIGVLHIATPRVAVCVAVQCTVLQSTAVCQSMIGALRGRPKWCPCQKSPIQRSKEPKFKRDPVVLSKDGEEHGIGIFCCRVLHCVALCCRVLQGVAVLFSGSCPMSKEPYSRSKETFHIKRLSISKESYSTSKETYKRDSRENVQKSSKECQKRRQCQKSCIHSQKRHVNETLVNVKRAPSNVKRDVNFKRAAFNIKRAASNGKRVLFHVKRDI